MSKFGGSKCVCHHPTQPGQRLIRLRQSLSIYDLTHSDHLASSRAWPLFSGCAGSHGAEGETRARNQQGVGFLISQADLEYIACKLTCSLSQPCRPLQITSHDLPPTSTFSSVQACRALSYLTLVTACCLPLLRLDLLHFRSSRLLDLRTDSLEHRARRSRDDRSGRPLSRGSRQESDLKPQTSASRLLASRALE